jgi:hypothetical protein
MGFSFAKEWATGVEKQGEVLNNQSVFMNAWIRAGYYERKWILQKMRWNNNIREANELVHYTPELTESQHNDAYEELQQFIYKFSKKWQDLGLTALV